jgi:hypothetical protein
MPAVPVKPHRYARLVGAGDDEGAKVRARALLCPDPPVEIRASRIAHALRRLILSSIARAGFDASQESFQFRQRAAHRPRSGRAPRG